MIDRDAADYGWSVDQAPGYDVHFFPSTGLAVNHMDRLTAITHEFGNTTGLSDLDAWLASLISGRLKLG